MKRIWGIPLVALLLILLSSCAEGNSRTDGEAQILVRAIGYPHHNSAEMYGRAALATTLGGSSDFSVLEVREVPHTNDPQDVSAHLVFRIHHDGVQGDIFATTDPVTACYSADFNYYGAVNGAERIHCPANAVAITFPPAPPGPQVPGTFDQPLQAILTALPADTTQPDRRVSVKWKAYQVLGELLGQCASTTCRRWVRSLRAEVIRGPHRRGARNLCNHHRGNDWQKW